MSSPLVSSIRNPRFLKLWAGQCISALGDRFTELALLALAIHGQTSAEQAWLDFWMFLPWLLFGPFAGVLVDRFPRKPLLIGADLARAALVLGILGLGLKEGGSLAPAYPFLFAMGLMTSIFSPAKSASLPDLVAPAQVLPSGALLAATGVIATALGGKLAGRILDSAGYRPCLLFDAASYVISALAVAWIAFPRRARGPRLKAGEVLGNLRAGFAEIRRNPELVKICGFMFVFWFVANSVKVIAPNFGKEALGLSGSMESLAGDPMLAAGLGLLAGAGATAAVGHRLARRAAYCLAASGMGVSLLMLSTARSLPGLFAWMGATGFWGGSLVSRIDADILKVIAPEVRGRVFGATSVLFAAAVLSPLLPVGWLSEHLAAAQILRMLGLMLVGLGAVVLVRLVGDLKAGQRLLLPPVKPRG